MRVLLSKSMKKIQAFLLVTSMIISSFSPAISAKADTGGRSPSGNESFQNLNNGETNSGGIKLTKKIIKFDESTDEYTVDLNVDGYSKEVEETVTNPLDVVLVLDKTKTMHSYGRMANAKKAAKAFVDSVDKKIEKQ